MSVPIAIREAVAPAVLAAAARAQEVLTTDKSQPQAPAKTESEAAPAVRKSSPDELVIQNRKDKISYAFGLDLGRSLNKKTEETFLIENAKKEGVVTPPRGLQYQILKKGDGKTPRLKDKVACNYRATFLDGTEFNGSYKRNEPTTVPVKGLIKGLSEALQLMPAGSKGQLFVPPQLVHGERSVCGTGPNAVVLFEVKLLSIQKPKALTPTPRAAKNPTKIEHGPEK